MLNIVWLKAALLVTISLPSGVDGTATRVGPDRYRIDGTAVELRTVGCTVTSDRHPVRVSVPDPKGRRWLKFVGEGDPCELLRGPGGRR